MDYVWLPCAAEVALALCTFRAFLAPSSGRSSLKPARAQATQADPSRIRMTILIEISRIIIIIIIMIRIMAFMIIMRTRIKQLITTLRTTVVITEFSVLERALNGLLFACQDWCLLQSASRRSVDGKGPLLLGKPRSLPWQVLDRVEIPDDFPEANPQGIPNRFWQWRGQRSPTAIVQAIDARDLSGIPESGFLHLVQEFILFLIIARQWWDSTQHPRPH